MHHAVERMRIDVAGDEADAGVGRAADGDALHALEVAKADGIGPIGEPPAVGMLIGLAQLRRRQLLAVVLREPRAVDAPSAQDDDDVGPLPRVYEGQRLEERRHTLWLAGDLHRAHAEAWGTDLCVEGGRRLDVLGDVEGTPHLIPPREARRERPERAVSPSARGGEGRRKEVGRGHRALQTVAAHRRRQGGVVPHTLLWVCERFLPLG